MLHTQGGGLVHALYIALTHCSAVDCLSATDQEPEDQRCYGEIKRIKQCYLLCGSLHFTKLLHHLKLLGQARACMEWGMHGYGVCMGIGMGYGVRGMGYGVHTLVMSQSPCVMCEYPQMSSTFSHWPPSLNVPPHTRLNTRSSLSDVLRLPHGHRWTMGVGLMSDSAHKTPVVLKL